MVKRKPLPLPLPEIMPLLSTQKQTLLISCHGLYNSDMLHTHTRLYFLLNRSVYSVINNDYPVGKTNERNNNMIKVKK